MTYQAFFRVDPTSFKILDAEKEITKDLNSGEVFIKGMVSSLRVPDESGPQLSFDELVDEQGIYYSPSGSTEPFNKHLSRWSSGWYNTFYYDPNRNNPIAEILNKGKVITFDGSPTSFFASNDTLFYMGRGHQSRGLIQNRTR